MFLLVKGLVGFFSEKESQVGQLDDVFEADGSGLVGGNSVHERSVAAVMVGDPNPTLLDAKVAMLCRDSGMVAQLGTPNKEIAERETIVSAS